MRSGKAYAVGGGRGAGPGRLEAVRRHFEVWRKTRQGRARIPERLWTSAVKLAVTYGLCRTAQTLGLNYTALKDRIEVGGLSGHEGLKLRPRSTSLDDSPTERGPAQRMSVQGSASALKNFKATPRIAKPAQQNPAMTFLELAPAEHAGRPEWMIELEHPRGAKMRIHIMGSPIPAVITAVSKVFFGART